MTDIFTRGDELGPAKIIYVRQPEYNLKGILVVDNVAAGPAIGGLRMAPDVSELECARLARAMTLKNASAGLAHGGAKSVLFGDPGMPGQDKEQLIRAFASALSGNTEYIFGPDMGTNETCMAWVQDEIGRAVGLPREIGGIPLDEIGATGWGISHATEVALAHCNLTPGNIRVAIQGFGAVGMHSARYLAKKGATIIAVSDSKSTLYAPDGLDLAALIRLKKAGAALSDYETGQHLSRDAIIDIACDVWIPAARPDVINEDNQKRLNTRLIVQGANIPLTRAAEVLLHKRGILIIPDFIANAGGVICAAMEYRHLGQTAAFEVIKEKIRQNTEEILNAARAQKIAPRLAAEQVATGRVKQAMAFKRWSIF
ncbi:MAG: Glu/Leu/Phe/Val family dehydrogenase [Pontibacterium sp.]